MSTERRIVIEGVKYGRPFRESMMCFGPDDAVRKMADYQARIEKPPTDGLTSFRPTILRAELRTREVSDWETAEEVGRAPIVDNWLKGDRLKIHDVDDIKALEEA